MAREGVCTEFCKGSIREFDKLLQGFWALAPGLKVYLEDHGT